MICDFPLFLAAWNAVQNQSTPRVHMKIAKWLHANHATPSPRLLLMAFRSCGKSTLVGIFCAWCLAKSPDTRILVLSADLALARKMVRNVKRIIEKHPLTKHLKPEKLDQWGSEKFTVNRQQELRDPSMLAKGITTNLTGTRADIIICDDVEVPKTSDSTDKREELRERLMELDYILTPHGMQIYVGTPHCWNSIYAKETRKELGEDAPFLNGFSRLVQPILNTKKESVWPERFSIKAIDEILKKTGPAHFQSQMMCEPSNIKNMRLNPAALQIYEDEIIHREAGGERISMIGERKMVAISGWWDPAFGTEGGDRSVVAIIYKDDHGEYWLHRLAQLKVTKDSEIDEASQQCKQVAKIAKEFFLPCIALETNGIGKFLPTMLKNNLKLVGAMPVINEIHQRKSKTLRITDGFDAILAARALHIHRNILDTPFIREMEDWRPHKNSGHDDCLDAVAGALSMPFTRIGQIRQTDHTSPQWVAIIPRSNSAKTEFEV